VASFPSNVGGGVLKRFAVTFDYDNSTMYLKPIKGAVTDLDTFDRSGMWINAVPEGLKVIDITKGGPAEGAGLAKDDVITAIDGKPAAGISLPETRERLRNEKPGTVVTLAVKGKGDVKIALRDMI
jgi:C-terminal processing protease CtpA/Prc